MEFQAAQFEEPTGWPSSSRSQYAAIVTIVVLVAAGVAGAWFIAAGLAMLVAAAVLLGWIVYSVARGNCDRIVIGWVLLYPLGYYLLSYPRDRPVIQFDRLIIIVLLAGILAAPRASTWSVPADLKRAAISWTLFVAAACISFLQTDNILRVGREILDALLLPSILGWYTVRQFRLGRHAKWLHACICIISLYCAVIGITEVALHRDLLAFESSDDYLLYDPTDPTQFAYIRPNGPFVANNSYAISGLISFFLLGFLWTLVRERAGRAHRVFHVLGSFAALVQALLPLFRSVALTLVIVAFIDAFAHTGRRRALRFAAVGLLPILAIGLAVLAPAAFQDRSDSSGFSARLSQDQQTWRMFIDHSVLGVGLFNFLPVAQHSPRYQVSGFGNEPPLNFPHNSVGWVAVETGMVGVIPFLLSQALLFSAFRRLVRRGEKGRKAYKYFVYIFLAYWITGFTENVAMYGELNMWFIFAAALLYRYGYGESDSTNVLALETAA